LYLQEKARLHDVDWRVQWAGAEAVKSFDSLRFLGATFSLVKAQRSRGSHLHKTVEAFRCLVDTLKGQLEATHQATAHAANVAMAAREAEEGAERQRRELAATQSKIQHHVASFAQGLGKTVIDCLQELPEGVQAEIKNRNLLRARHSRDLRLAQAKILQGVASWIFTAVEGGARADQLSAEGHELIALPDESGKVDLRALMNELGLREINELHVEAGFKLNGSLLRAGVVDELLLYLAPFLLGPAQGLARLPVLEHLSDRLAFRFHEVEQVGPDLRLRVMRSTP
jgi:riboflavin biosynthesis pyrimidine reductase